MSEELTPYKAAELTQEQVDLIKSTMFAGSSDEEFRLFLYQCKRTGLDPLSKQIFPIKRWNSQQRKEVMSLQVSIDGFRLVAERTGKYLGQAPKMWCGEDGVWKDVWLSKTPPSAAKAGVYKQGNPEPTYAVAMWEEYKQTTKDGKISSMWAKMPAGMLAKCAEALALRQAFPQELSGLYTNEEMAQADNVEVPAREAVKAEPPKPDNPNRNYTEEANSCTTLDELKAWYLGLTKEEQIKYRALKDSRKDDLSKPAPVEDAVVVSETPSLQVLINSVTAKDFSLVDDEITVSPLIAKIEGEILKYKKAQEKRVWINALQHKVDGLKVPYTVKVVPF